MAPALVSGCVNACLTLYVFLLQTIHTSESRQYVEAVGYYNSWISYATNMEDANVRKWLVPCDEEAQF